MQVESLLDPQYMGGLDGAGGYRFETTYILTRIPSWISLAGLQAFQQEGWSDVELFFASGTRQLIQIKDHALELADFKKIVRDFSTRERTATCKYEKYFIASAGLTRSIGKLSRQLARYRDLGLYSRRERSDVAEQIKETLTRFGLNEHHDLILKKLYFDSDIAFMRDGDFCRTAFLGALISTYRLTADSADDIFLRTAQLLNTTRGKPIKISVFRETVSQKQLEDQAAFLSSFTLITKSFLQSLKKEAHRSFFYTGAAPTWSDIVNEHDIPRDIATAIMRRIAKWKGGKLLIPIVAEAGEGKSTLLRRLAADLVTKKKTVLYHTSTTAIADVKEVQRVANIANQCVYIFFDEASKIQNFEGFIESISELPITTVIVAAARPYEMKSVRATYSDNLQIGIDDRGEYSLHGLSDHEMELLVDYLTHAKLLTIAPGVKKNVLVEAIKKRTNRKFLVLVMEITQGERVHDIIRDEIDRIRQKGETVLTAYRYICLMASVDSFMSLPLIEKLLDQENAMLDVVSQLPGLLTVDGERLHPRHNRIGEIATEIFFAGHDEQLGSTLCHIVSTAFKHGHLDVVRSATRISHSLPKSQVIKVINHIIDEAYCFGDDELIRDLMEDFEWDTKNTERFLKVLAAKTPLIWSNLIFPGGPDLQWQKIESHFEVSFSWPSCTKLNRSNASVRPSLERCLKWAEVFGLATWHYRDERAFFVAVTDKMYECLAKLHPENLGEICFQHAEFLRSASKEKESIELYERVIESMPDYADAHAGLSLALYLTECYERALDHFKLALKLDPKSLFRIRDESIFEEMTERLTELEEYIEYRKGLVGQNYKIGRGFQSMIAREPTLLVDLKSPKPGELNAGFSVFNNGDYSKQAEERDLAKLDHLLEYLPKIGNDERRRLEKLFSKRFGELREQLHKKRARRQKKTN